MTQHRNNQTHEKNWWYIYGVSLVVFILVFFLLNAAVNLICPALIAFDCPVTWPISIMSYRVIPWIDIVKTIILLVVFTGGVVILRQLDYAAWFAILLSVVVVVASNFIPGWQIGYDVPILYGDELYYYDAQRVEKPTEFISDYVYRQQHTLYKHARTNPPGAVLNLYFLNQLIPSPGMMTLIITTITSALSAFFLYSLFEKLLQSIQIPAGYATVMAMSVPSMQIYYTHSVDPIMTTALFGTLYFIICRDSLWISVIGATICLWYASFISFLFIVILPVLVLMVIFYQPYRSKIALVLVGGLLAHGILYITMDYNYAASFLTASNIENPNGFSLLATPATYVGTRLESLAEVFLFLTPFALVWWKIGITNLITHKNIALVLFGSCLVSFGSLLLIGTFSTGEAARLMIFLVPFFLLPTLYGIQWIGDHSRHLDTLLIAIASQGFLMQLVVIFFA